uniref:SV2-like protein 2 n=1 Tax=Ctenocephalides felis TaxID=7515 RepID=Q6U1H1_CTEFE|nr:SV2-like protein 2 [Ctenocephalides felis]
MVQTDPGPRRLLNSDVKDDQPPSTNDEISPSATAPSSNVNESNGNLTESQPLSQNTSTNTPLETSNTSLAESSSTKSAADVNNSKQNTDTQSKDGLSPLLKRDLTASTKFLKNISQLELKGQDDGEDKNELKDQTEVSQHDLTSQKTLTDPTTLVTRANDNSSKKSSLKLKNGGSVNSDKRGKNDPEKGQSDPSKKIAADFETAIDMTGYGKFHYALLAVCGFVSTSEEMDVISMSFILPSAQCDLKLNTHTKGWLNSIIFIGMMFGAYLWGSLADSVGRKRVLIAISFMNALCIVASSFSQSYGLFMLFRFLNGAALGGSGPVIWSYFAEFQPKAKRGSMLSSMAAFWTLGNLCVAGLAWAVIPQASLGYHGVHFTYNSWRIFLSLCAVPSLIVAVLLFFLPESPKFLLARGKQEEALEIFRGIFHTNTGKPRDQFPVCELIPDEPLPGQTPQQRSLTNLFQHNDAQETNNQIKSSGDLIKSASKENVIMYLDAKKQENVEISYNSDKMKIGKNKRKGKYSRMLSDMAENSKQLFRPPILRFTLISITINFTFHIGYYGLMMWFPELFNRFDEYTRHHLTDGNEVTANVCEVTNFVVSRHLDQHHDDFGVTKGASGPVCDDVIPAAVFLESLITVAAAIPSNIIAVIGMDRLGRKFFLVFSTFTSGVCAACMFFVYNKRHNLIVSAVFSSVISCGNAALDCLITEVFPTNLRATGVAISMVAARLGGIIGNVVIATLLDMYCPAPTFIVALLLAGGGLMCLFLPNTTREPLS